MILTVYFQALKETDPASHKVTSGRWGKIYGTSLKEELDLEQGGKNPPTPELFGFTGLGVGLLERGSEG